ncbi:E3 ubiquitin-protein ligase Mdm2 [Pungitius pungitius]|uniref:E3 ubiquitin-protein ligase Mdm2 n=1 Tax=Pungitius pungitius TaxID=134920 RepID=UPI002E0F0442
MSVVGGLNSDADDNKLVRPKLEFRTLLHHAGAIQEVFTMKEVMFYLGQYIILKQLYDQKQQHIVHCSQDALGRVLGVDSFSVKEPRVLFAMISKNLVAVKSQEAAASSSEATSASQTEEAASERHSPERRSRRRRRRSRRSLRSSSESAGSSRPSDSLEGDKKESEEESGEEDDEEDGEVEGRKRRRSDSYSLTFDESLSWCVIGGLPSVRDRHSSQSSDSHSTSGRSEVTAAASDSDSDHFSVEFEVESVDSDDYDEDDASLSADDQIYEVTIFEDNDSFDEDTEITEADYWRCAKCEELNPPLPRNCLRCWELRQDWLCEVSPDVTKPASSSPKALAPKPTGQSAAKDTQGSDVEDNDGVDVPDGKRVKTPPPPPCHSDSSQPSSTDSQESCPPPRAAAAWQLPESCLDPCLICQSRPKNGCIVHGRTGHLMCCYVCARKLKKRNKLCPVCRLPIDSVVLTYVC